MKRPRMRVKNEQMTSSQPCNLSHPRFMGKASAGSEMRNVKNMRIALTMPASTSFRLYIVLFYGEVIIPVKGHWESKMSYATFATFFVPCSCCSLTRQKPNNRPPVHRNRKSAVKKVSMSLFIATAREGEQWLPEPTQRNEQEVKVGTKK